MSDLDAVMARIANCKTYNFGMRDADQLAHEDAPALIERVKRAEAVIAEAKEMLCLAGDSRAIRIEAHRILAAYQNGADHDEL